MSAEIINAFGRTAEDPLPSAAEVTICEPSMLLAKELLRMAETGEIESLAFACIHRGSPMSGCVVPHRGTIAGLSMLSVAADSLKNQVKGRVAEWARDTHIAEDGLEVDDD